MWNFDVHSAANRAQTRQLQDSDAESIAVSRLSQEAQQESFSLENHLAQSSFNLSQSWLKSQESAWRGSWLEASRQAVKDDAANLPAPSVSTPHSMPRLGVNAAPVADVRQNTQAFQSPAPATNAVQPQAPVLSEAPPSVTPVPSPLPVVSALPVSDSRAAVPLLPPSNSGKDSVVDQVSLSGTQDAPQSQPLMSFSFSAQHDNSRQRLRGQAFGYDEEAAGVSAARPRQGAIIEPPPTTFRDVALQETFMSRMQELIARLSAMGQSWARVVVPVDSQTKVIVRFNNANGRVKIHMSTPSEGLVALIKAGWKILTEGAAQNGISVDEPTFDNSNYDN